MNTVDTYREFAQFYDLYTTNFKIDLPLYLHYCNEHHNILEVGCGTGRVLSSLVEAGCKVYGVDISDAMLGIAERKLQEQIVKGTIRLKNFDFSNGSLEEEFDRVLITFYTLNYLTDADQCQRFIQNIKKSLSNNGLMLIDLFYPRSFQNPESNGVWFEKDIVFENKKIKLRDQRTVINNIEQRVQEYIAQDWEKQIITKRRFYSKDEIQLILERCGFKNIEFTDEYQIDDFHKLNSFETVKSSFVVKAQ